MRLLRVTHNTTYRHGSSVAASWQVLRLRPRDTDTQECVSFELEIRPRPEDLVERKDFFGNSQHLFSIREPHQELNVDTVSVVRRPTPDATETPPWPSLHDAVEETVIATAGGQPEIEQFRHPTFLAPELEETRNLAKDGAGAEISLPRWIEHVGDEIRKTYAFDATASSISTPLATVIAQRRGVCQDFAHVFLSCARQHGLAAAYVSGYLLTDPPPGQPRLRGADAMHAWVAVYAPGHGWVDYDPTNGGFVDDRYVAVARGRDYADACPIRGLFRGGGAHSLFLGVTVEPLAEESRQ